MQLKIKAGITTKALDKLRENLSGIERLTASVGMICLRSVLKNFTAGGRPSKWVPLKDSTILSRRKGRRGGVANPLRDTGALMNGIHYERISPTSFAIATAPTSRAYAAAHQFGATTAPHFIVPGKGKKALRWMTAGGPAFAKWVAHPGSKIPARPYMVIQPEDYAEACAMLRRKLAGMGA